jgi:hypothetical protein
VWIPLVAVLVGVPVGRALAEELEHDAAYLPDLGGHLLAVQNPLGDVTVRGWDEPQIRIIAAKRAGSPALLERLKVQFVFLHDGRVQISTGFYLADRTFMPLPLKGAGIDLTIDAPRRLHVEVQASGAIDAAGFHRGAQLSSQGGEIRVADMAGPVDTRTLDGRQWLQSIHGSLAATGVRGDVELSEVEGDTVDASVNHGNIYARDVTGAAVRLRTTVGTIVFMGALATGGRYQFSTLRGDVRLALEPVPFRFVARAPSVRNRFDARNAEARAGFLRGQVGASGEAGPSLDLVSGQGEVVVAPASLGLGMATPPPPPPAPAAIVPAALRRR